MTPRLVTAEVRDHDDVRAFFDRSADLYAEQHGDADRLLRYRANLLREVARFRADDSVLEIGCGDGMHLFALADSFARGTGVDISAAMVARASDIAERSGLGDKLRFIASLGEELAGIDDASIDVAWCVGSLEHMLDQPAVTRAAFRVLSHSVNGAGRFIGLTPNGGYFWYRRLAPLLGIATQHLATDHFLTRDELTALLRNAGFSDIRIDSWTFIPRGDMPHWTAALLSVMDAIARAFRISAWRGGLRFVATR